VADEPEPNGVLRSLRFTIGIFIHSSGCDIQDLHDRRSKRGIQGRRESTSISIEDVIPLLIAAFLLAVSLVEGVAILSAASQFQPK